MTYVSIRAMYTSIAENDGKTIANAWRRVFPLKTEQVSIAEASATRDAVHSRYAQIIPAGGRTNSRSDEGTFVFNEPLLAH